MNRWQFRLFQDSRFRFAGQDNVAPRLDYTPNFSNIANSNRTDLALFYIYISSMEGNNFHFRSNILYLLNSENFEPLVILPLVI